MYHAHRVLERIAEVLIQMAFYCHKNDIGRIGLLVALFAALAFPAIGGAQEEEINVETTVRLTLGKSAAQPNETALVPIYFAPPKSTAIGRVKFDVTFVSVNMKFDKLEAGPMADAGQVNYHTELKPGKNEKGVETTTVTIQAEVPEQSADGLPSGLLAYLSLRLSAEAKPALITLRTSAAEAIRHGSNEPVRDVRAFDSQVEVQVAGFSPTSVCFFFSH
jgi:hypothetical protein